jgi:GH15 family glucan-1,4-alpha-glucosidase
MSAGMAEADKEAPAIEDHGVIGDMRTLALVALDGTIDYFCHPNIDSPTIFASLLDLDRGGAFRIDSADPPLRRQQLYLPDTNILLTRSLCEGGVGELSDFMPLDGSGRLIRRIKAVQGKMRVALHCAPRFDYAREVPQVAPIEGGCIFEGGGRQLFLYCTAPLELAEGAAHAAFALDDGEHAYAVLCPGRKEVPQVDDAYVSESFKATADFWRAWVAEGRYPHRWSETVVRSALALKLLTSSRYGSIAAAATFGLPEVIGGTRNWDYRYCWVRDAAFTLYALARLNYFDEARHFIEFMEERALHPDGSMQIMYGMDGRADLPERELEHLSGYRDSRPVRIGNAAYKQLQLDIYGELMDAIYIASRRLGQPFKAVWSRLAGMVDWVCENWQLADEGIWEVRGPKREFLSSRLLCWVAVDRAMRLAESQSLPAPIDRWRAARDAIHANIMTELWDEEIGAFVQYRGAKALDAAVLLMPLLKFINPRDPPWLRTMEAVEERLVHDCLVYRYDNEATGVDGLAGEEGAFTTCSFWYIECLARGGDLQKARFLFEKMLSYGNHVGLYAEELSTSGAHLGNFPQALTHLALISTASWLDRALDRPITSTDALQRASEIARAAKESR